jgi:hypothetical protein
MPNDINTGTAKLWRIIVAQPKVAEGQSKCQLSGQLSATRHQADDEHSVLGGYLGSLPKSQVNKSQRWMAQRWLVDACG